MKGASVVVDVSNAPSWEDAAVMNCGGLVVNEFCLLALSMGPFGERSTSRVAKASSFQDKAAWRGSLTPFVVFAAEKQKSEHGD
jgi:hypothetical protein